MACHLASSVKLGLHRFDETFMGLPEITFVISTHRNYSVIHSLAKVLFAVGLGLKATSLVQH